MVRFDGLAVTCRALRCFAGGRQEAARSIFPAPLTRGRGGRPGHPRAPDRPHPRRRRDHSLSTPPGISISAATAGTDALSLPLLRDAELNGGLLVMWRREVRPLSQKEIDLITTFADQAVIASRTSACSRSSRPATAIPSYTADPGLPQQTATSDVLRVISSSPTDLQPVLEGDRGKRRAAVRCDRCRDLSRPRRPPRRAAAFGHPDAPPGRTSSRLGDRPPSRAEEPPCP